MIHMPNLESWEWGLMIFDGAPTLTTHVDHPPVTQDTQTEHNPRAQTYVLVVHGG